MGKALILLLLIPTIEMMVLIEVGSQIGSVLTIALVFLTAIVGVGIIRQQGMATLLRAQEKIESGAVPALEIAEGFLLALAGAFLLIPGFVTDTIGALLLLPFFRRTIATVLFVKFVTNRSSHSSYSQYSQQGKDSSVIEGEFEKESDDKISKN